MEQLDQVVVREAIHTRTLRWLDAQDKTAFGRRPALSSYSFERPEGDSGPHDGRRPDSRGDGRGGQVSGPGQGIGLNMSFALYYGL